VRVDAEPERAELAAPEQAAVEARGLGREFGDVVAVDALDLTIPQGLTMPLFFASNAIYPIDMMPDWLRVVAKMNPLTYLVDLFRSLMVKGGESAFGYDTDLAVLVVLVFVAARLYPSVAA
jgi:ABC-type multidrug transport system permease subunit